MVIAINYIRSAIKYFCVKNVKTRIENEKYEESKRPYKCYWPTIL